MKKRTKKHQVPISSLYLLWVIYWDKPVYIFARQSNSLLLNMQNVTFHLLFIITFVCLSVPQIVAYFYAAKLSIKLFSLIYFPVSVVRKWDEFEIVTETRPIKTI